MADNTIKGTAQKNPYGGDNTKDYTQAITDQYDAMVKDQNQSVDKAVNSGSKAQTAIRASGNEMLDKQTDAENRLYRETKDRLSSIEQNNGNRQAIGSSQYGPAELTLDQSMGGIAEQRSRLERDTAREVANLRAKGDYTKASAALQTAQQKFQQLYSEALRQDSNLRGNYEYITGLQREDQAIQRDQDASDKQWQQKLGQMLLSKGIMPEEGTLGAMGIDQPTAQVYLNAIGGYGYGGGSGGGGGTGKSGGSSGSGYSGTGSGAGTNDDEDVNIQGSVSNYSNPIAKQVLALASKGNIKQAETLLVNSAAYFNEKNMTTLYNSAWKKYSSWHKKTYDTSQRDKKTGGR